MRLYSVQHSAELSETRLRKVMSNHIQSITMIIPQDLELGFFVNV